MVGLRFGKTRTVFFERRSVVTFPLGKTGMVFFEKRRELAKSCIGGLPLSRSGVEGWGGLNLWTRSSIAAVPWSVAEVVGILDFLGRKVTESELRVALVINVIVTIMLGGRFDVPSMLAVVGPGIDALLFLFENTTLGSEGGHWGSVEIEISKELVVGGQLRVDSRQSEHVECDDSL